ncbi:hypothetical protein [Myxococcus sp. Y35]|uniref:hypothetical protein n=1 Tax=Pseudomyxococcus flavus TaxID=3115648 RepID=UPI003CEBEACD
MRHLVPALLSASLLVGCGPAESEPSSPSTERQGAPLTTTDVDVAPECQGILTYLNTASFEALDAYLPSNVATNLVNQRATAPFTTMAQVASVSGVGAARLTQIEGASRELGFITSTCAGIYDELALSTEDAAAVVSLVNTVAAHTLYAILPNASTGAANLIGLRPFSSIQAVSATSGIGSASLRDLRNAATQGYALAELIAAINAQPESLWTSRLSQNFSVESVLNGAYSNGGRLDNATCFGIDPNLYPEGEWNTRPALATGAEVLGQVESTVGYAERNGPLAEEVITAGLAELEANTAGGTFKGCYISYYTEASWAGTVVAFFIDTATGYRVLTAQDWVE